jgi:molecular chaperone DnaK
MNNQNILIGIDLGTTNSEIAVNTGDEIEIVKNIFGSEFTPSVFGIDKSKNKIVGKKAYEKLFKDATEEEIANYKAEVKRIIGTPDKVFFPRLNQYLSSEEISAEILKSLKEDLLRKYPDFPVNAAVITVPASFDTTQAEATKRAGNLAGFRYVVLLQEPIAAAFAYGYSNAGNMNILVYDLGGGTFDVALLSSKNGSLSVLSHNGDNFLGGKDIDKDIVEKIIRPQITGQFQFHKFEKSNEKFKPVFAKLKYSAEVTKIDLSSFPKTTLEVENIGNDDSGKEVYLSIPLLRSDFENLIKPLVDRTIELTKKTIKESGITPASIHKIVLVGGPTQIPYIRERLCKDLNIPVDTSMDPLTVVARGACIFAMSQQIPDELREQGKTTMVGAKKITLFYNSLSSETEETVSGIIDDLKDSVDEYKLQIQSESGHYSSQKIRVNGGKFFDTVSLLPKQNNLFWLYLFDKDGRSIPVDPDLFSITNGLSVSGAPIPHSIGISLAERDLNNSLIVKETMEFFFPKGSILPLKSEFRKYHTFKLLKKGEDNYLPIKVYEGESEIPDRNGFVCDVKINGKDLPFDLPEKTEVEIQLEVNESREVTVKAYIPSIDLSLNARGSILSETLDLNQLSDNYRKELERGSKLEENCTLEERLKIHQLASSIDDSLKNANNDEDEKRKANKQLKDLKIYFDTLEKEKEIPQLAKEFSSLINEVKEIIEKNSQSPQKETFQKQLENLKIEGEKATQENDKFLLIRVNEQLGDLARKVLYNNPGYWVYHYNNLIKEDRSKFLNQQEATYYIDKGKKCIDQGDVDGLKDSVLKLIALLPPEKKIEMQTAIAGITR